MRQPRMLAGMVALCCRQSVLDAPIKRQSYCGACQSYVGFLTKGGRAPGAAPRPRLLVETLCTRTITQNSQRKSRDARRIASPPLAAAESE